MDSLVTIDGKRVLRTSTAILAEGFGIEHKWMMDTIEKYKSDFLDLGEFVESKEIIIRGFKPNIRNKKSRVLLLNETQVNFLGTLTNNTEKTVPFKKRLVQEFTRARDILKKLIANQTGTDFIGALPEWKATRRTLTDAIQDYNDYRVQRGKDEDKWIYSNITKLVNTQLFDFQGVEIDAKVNKRSLLSDKQRRKLCDTEDDLVEIIMNNLDNPYAKIKEYLEMRLKFVNKSVVIDDQLKLLSK